MTIAEILATVTLRAGFNSAVVVAGTACLGIAAGVIGSFMLLRKRAAIIATALRPRPVAEKTEIMEAVRDAVWPLLTDGRNRPQLAKTNPL